MTVTVRWNGVAHVEEAVETPYEDMTIGEYARAFADAHGIDADRHPRITLEGDELPGDGSVAELDGLAVFVTVDPAAPTAADVEFAADGTPVTIGLPGARATSNESGVGVNVPPVTTSNDPGDGRTLKLGKHLKRVDDRTLQLAAYIDLSALPKAPPSVSWAEHVETWPMYLNDELGDCTCAAAGHGEQLTSAINHREFDVTDTDVERLYELVSGYDPTTGQNDNGAVILDVLNALRKVGIGGHKIGAFAEIDITNDNLLRAAIDLFPAVPIGVALPTELQKQANDPSKVWNKPRNLKGPNAPGSWGGHCVIFVGYDAKTLSFVSWGQVYRMSWSFWHAYGDEAWATLAAEWIADGTTAPTGVKIAALEADLKAVAA